MTTIKYKITFFSEWHAGSGLTSGSDLNALVIKDKNGLPFIPGRTLKGLLREAAEELTKLHADKFSETFIKTVFGLPAEQLKEELNDREDKNASEKGECFFTNATISNDLKSVAISEKLVSYFYRSLASTSIGINGVAQKGSLRSMETTIPCILEAEITEVPEHFLIQLENCLQWIKRLGQNRHRGLGRCQFEMIEEEAVL